LSGILLQVDPHWYAREVASYHFTPQGFMLYRLMMPLINEAFYVVMEGTSSAEDVRIYI
jgi:hypothetical protein